MMQDTILLQYLSKKLHTHAYKLTIDGEITAKSLLFRIPISKTRSFWAFYWNHCHREFLV